MNNPPTINPDECRVLRALYKEGIRWRAVDSVTDKVLQLASDKQVDPDKVDPYKVLQFANATESPPPTRSIHHASIEDKVAAAMANLALALGTKGK